MKRTHDDERLDAILNDACAEKITLEAAVDAIEADPALYKAWVKRIILDEIQRSDDRVLTDAELMRVLRGSGDRMFTDAELLERLAKGNTDRDRD
jgi:hypothetical protein